MVQSNYCETHSSIIDLHLFFFFVFFNSLETCWTIQSIIKLYFRLVRLTLLLLSHQHLLKL